MPVNGSSKYDILLERPPTPPRDVTKDIDDAIEFLDDSHEIDQELARYKRRKLKHDTTERTPLKTGETEPLHAGKRVGFVPSPTYAPIAETIGGGSVTAIQVKQRSPTQHAGPIKSILKPCLQTPLTPDDLEKKLCYFSPQEPGSFARMLQSVISQLAGQTGSSRLDAYLALNGALKAYDGVPDCDAMIAKMPTLMQFLARDIAWKDDNGSLDTNIVMQALKLTAAVLHNPVLSKAVDDDFRTFLVERSITVLDNADFPKQIIKTHAYLLAQQGFSSVIVTAARADRIITSANTLEDRCSGNSIVATRLVIYQRLVEQVPAIMLMRMRDWVEHVFHGMLSSIKDIRLRAIEACTQSALRLGTNAAAAKGIHELLETDVEEGRKYFDFLRDRLMQDVANKEFGIYVPRIWAAIVLFFRSKRKRLSNWPRLHLWLTVIQRCLNSSDLTIKREAHLAWDKLIFTIMPDSSVSQALLSMLKVPITSEFAKKRNHTSKETQQFAIDNYYTLLYYTLRPNLSYKELDVSWDLYVQPVLSDIAKTSSRGRQIACRVMSGLFTASSGVWDEKVAIAEEPVKPEELPRLDPRWLRSRFAKMLTLLEPIMKAFVSLPPDSMEILETTWISLMKAVGEAGSQEVRTSTELKEAIAAMMNLFTRLWTGHYAKPSGSKTHAVARTLSSIACYAIQQLGCAHFTEDNLVRSENDDIEAAPTPSHRASKHHKSPESPLVFLARLFRSSPSQVDFAAFADILHHCVTSRPTSNSLKLLCQTLRTLQSGSTDKPGRDVSANLWGVFAEETILVLSQHAVQPVDKNSQQIGQQLRDAVSVLLAGVGKTLQNPSTIKIDADLYRAIGVAAKLHAGEGGMVVVLMEPFAKHLVQHDQDMSLSVRLQLVSLLLDNATWPRTRQAMEEARTALRGAGATSSKPPAFEPFDNVYIAIRTSLAKSYTKFEPGLANNVNDVLKNLFKFLQLCPASLVASTLRKIQDGLVLWIEDKEHKVFTDSQPTPLLSESVKDFWTFVLNILETLPIKDTNLLSALEPLISAAFSSPRRAIVNATIAFWNQAFGAQETLEYSERLVPILSALRDYVELNLPSFPENIGESVQVDLPAFVESQQEDERLPFANPPALLPDNTGRSATASPGFKITYSPLPKTAAVSNSAPSSLKRRSGTSHLKPKPRHEDSQIQFVSVENPPYAAQHSSQLLTDHQAEVRSRQSEQLQMFAGLSSSPVVSPIVVKRDLPRRLDFTSDQERDSERELTPALPDGVGGSDYLGSSPTPKVVNAIDAQETSLSDDEDGEDQHIVEPPSSPPREDNVPDTAVVTHPDQDQVDEGSTTVVEATRVDGPCDPAIDDGSSDTDLPDAQLLQEEELAARRRESPQLCSPRCYHPTSDAYVDAPDQPTAQDVENSSPIQFTQSPDAQGTPEQARKSSATQTDVTNEEETSLVEESFVDPAPQQNPSKSPSQSDSQSQDSFSKKRKRNSETVHSSKKRKSATPFKRLISSFLGRSQEAQEDENMEDEIIVASSQIVQVSASGEERQSAEAVSQEAGTTGAGRDVKSPTPPTKTEETIQVSTKRRRGRPRKSHTSNTPSSQLGSSQALKRKSSALSNAESQDAQTPRKEPNAAKDDTLVPAKSRKRKSEQNTGNPQVHEDEREASQRSLRRTVSAVLPSPPHRHLADETTATEQQVPSTPAKMHATPQQGQDIDETRVTRIQDRPIASPRSIMQRLRGILGDMKSVLLGSQEEREMDDILFELRRETHDAARRGRDEL